MIQQRFYSDHQELSHTFVKCPDAPFGREAVSHKAAQALLASIRKPSTAAHRSPPPSPTESGPESREGPTRAIIQPKKALPSTGIVMQRFLFLAALIGVLWALDAYAFQGRYRAALWQEANHQVQIFNGGVQSFVSKVNP